MDVAEAEGEAAAEEKVDLIVTEEDLRLARQTITPSALKEVQFEVPKVFAISLYHMFLLLLPAPGVKCVNVHVPFICPLRW